jgi:hypothetical protein
VGWGRRERHGRTGHVLWAYTLSDQAQHTPAGLLMTRVPPATVVKGLPPSTASDTALLAKPVI